jgi:enediyne biosynthesis protein E4
LKGLGVVTADFNNDGYPDVYVADDGEPNLLWINQKNGAFRNEAPSLGAAINSLGQPEAGMGIDAGDIDSDGDLDLFLTHLSAEKNTLYRNLGASGFQDDSWASGLAGPSVPFTGFGTGFFDFDNDGDLDVAVVNGRIARGNLLLHSSHPSYWDPYAEPNFLFANDGAGHFQNISNRAGSFCSNIQSSRGLAFGDIDNDGDIDLLVTGQGVPARLYRNNTDRKGHWLLVRAIDPALRRDMIGAKIIVNVRGKKLFRGVGPAYSYLCSNDPRVHFGLGAASNYDSVEVDWPGGKIERFAGGRANQILVLQKGHGR